MTGLLKGDWVRKMDLSQFWLILLSGVAIGLLLSMSLRWIGRRLLRGRSQKEGEHTGDLIDGV
ncbi:MAG: hypothetical protein ACETVW_03765 [Dehalococcoidia bacterium]